jgi:hypothetical protein
MRCKSRRWVGICITVAVAATLLVVSSAAFASVLPTLSHSAASGPIRPAASNDLDCNGWSPKYAAARPAMRALCTDPIHISPSGKASRLIDNGWYVGHDEPSVKFISSTAGSGNTMTYYMRLPVDPSAKPTADGSVTKYAELSIAPWFGLPMCDPNSYPQNPCTPDSDTNGGSGSSSDAGSAFMELQFYPPGFTPFGEATSCSKFQWCSAINIDSLECTFATCNNNCIEPVNFAYLQTNGVPSGPAAPQDPNLATFIGDAHTLRMSPGDVLKVSITDPAGGLTVRVNDLTSGQTGFMQASAVNGFANTSIADCSGTPFTFHAEYESAKQQNQVPWAALEGGVLMQQEIGHFESCNSVTSKEGFTVPGSYSDPNVYQSCSGGVEGPNATGEGPCNPITAICIGAETQGGVACPTNNAATGALCEFSDGYCFPAGARAVQINGSPGTETAAVAGCFQDQFQNGDLDFDGNSYRADWPNGSRNFPSSFRYVGPFTGGSLYPQIQFETDVGGSSALCNVVTGAGCATPPIGAAFYPFWSLNNRQVVSGSGHPAVCVWNFGNDIPNVTTTDFGGSGQYGTPDVARYGGTLASSVTSNPTLPRSCRHL